MKPFTASKKKVLFILPEILSPGGQELENVGFANCLQTDPRFEIQILNFFSFLKMDQFVNLPKVTWDLISLKHILLSKQFLKIFIKSGFKLKRSLANCFRNFPYLFDPWLRQTLSEFDICFTGISPVSLLPHIQLLCKEQNVAFVYHESSIFHQKNHAFFLQMEEYGHFLISAEEKENYLLSHYPAADYKIIRQWIYLGQQAFLSIPQKVTSKVKFGSVGRVDSGKNFILILNAIKILIERGYEVEFILSGDGPELRNLKEFAKNSGLNQAVSFTGSFPFEDRASCFEDFDVFILTSSFEGGPLVILEAMAAGKPVISTMVGDVPNRVLQNVNGFQLPINCMPKQVADCMQQYLDSKDMIQKHGLSSRELFRKEFEEQKGQYIFKEAIHQILEFHTNKRIA